MAAAYDKVDSNLDELAATPTVREFEQERNARIRGQKILIGLLVLVVLGGYVFTYIVAQDVGQEAARREILSSTVASLVQSNEAREERGLPPIDYSNVVDQLNEKGIVQAVSAAVIAQLEADPAFRGPAGFPGLNGLPGPEGAPGIGLNGADGTNGTNGTNGSSGLPGEKGLPGTDGVDGAPGPQGEPGEPGADGAEGPPPTSFTMDNQRCTRVGGTTDYNCEPIAEGP